MGSHKFSTDSRYSVLLDTLNTDFRLVIRDAVVTPHLQDLLAFLLVTLVPSLETLASLEAGQGRDGAGPRPVRVSAQHRPRQAARGGAGGPPRPRSHAPATPRPRARGGAGQQHRHPGGARHLLRGAARQPGQHHLRGAQPQAARAHLLVPRWSGDW